MNESFESENSRDESYEPESITPSKRHKTPAPEKESPPEKSSYTKIVVAVVLVLAILAGLFIKYSKDTNSQKKVLKTSKPSIDCSKFIDLKQKFGNQDEKLFKSLKTGIEGIYRNPQAPPVFTLFSTDESLMNTILNEIIEVARNCTKTDSEPINLTIEDIGSENFIATYKDELIKRKIMIVKNVDLFPTNLIQLLHSFTDTYNPIVSESIICFTVKVPLKPKGKPVEYIFNYLEEKWHQMPDNKRGPLITRFLDQTFYINSIRDDL
jgi:hypothetical protein